MLSDSKFIENSLISNLYYLRTLREFCARVQLSLPSNYKEYIDIAGKLAKQCEELGSKIMKYANRNIPSVALNVNLSLLKHKIFANHCKMVIFLSNLTFCYCVRFVRLI